MLHPYPHTEIVSVTIHLLSVIDQESLKVTASDNRATSIKAPENLCRFGRLFLDGDLWLVCPQGGLYMPAVV